MKNLQKDQQWIVADSRLKITMLGKTLVHFRIFKGNYKRSISTGLLNVDAFQDYLKRNKAVLVND